MFEPRLQDLSEIIEGCDSELKLLSDNKIVLTGCAGFLGRYFIELVALYNQNNERKKEY